MRLSTDTDTTIASGVINQRAFTIKASGKAFQILSGGLYSNKILAVIRELSANAYDSHVAAGCADKQFLVNIPDSFNSYFSIRDYGTGMKHEDVSLAPFCTRHGSIGSRDKARGARGWAR